MPVQRTFNQRIGRCLKMIFRSNHGQVLALLLVFASGCGAVNASGEDVGGGNRQQKDAYSIQVGDRIRVFVLGREDISGEYQLDMAGNIALPTLGGITAEGLTTERLGEQIAKAVAQATGEVAAVSATVAEYRPVFVLGDVKSSGSYPFMPGMTALQSVAMAGGFFNSGQEVANGPIARDMGADRDLEAQYQVLSLRRLRLLAEKAGHEALELTPELEARVDAEPLLFAVSEAEEALLTKRRQEYELKLEGFRRSGELFDNEARALENQIEVQKQLQDLLNKQAAGVKSLMDKGMVDQSVYLNLESQVAETKNGQRETEAFLARARQSSDAARQGALELEAARQQELEQSISDNAKELLGMQRRMQLSGMSGTGFNANAVHCAARPGAGLAASAEINIVRAGTMGKEMTIAADGSARLRPGDVVEVRIRCEDSDDD